MITLNTDGEVVGENGSGRKTHTGYVVSRSRHGKTDVDVECPYCGHLNYTALWSLAGSGKRCGGCFAHLGQLGAFRPTPEELKRLTKNDPRRVAWTQYYDSRTQPTPASNPGA